MRKLIVISTDLYVRNFVTSGALDAIDDGESWYVASETGVANEGNRAKLAELPNYLGTIEDPRRQASAPYRFLRRLLFVSARNKSRTMAVKTRLLPARQRRRMKLWSLPGIRRLRIRHALKASGLHPDLLRIIDEVRPRIVIAPTGGYDPLVWDAIRAARARGIPSLVLVHNWDNLSSKGVFAVDPDHLGVWGEQSAEHAMRIHGFPRERVSLLGAPSLDHYVRHVPGSTEARFPFRYVLFAGCFAPFDELAALRMLEDAIEREGLDLKIVYRPHPHRQLRLRDDFVDETQFRNVVLDPQLRDIYRASFEERRGKGRARPILPPLNTYPSLFEHSEFVICPLSTMIVEAALFEKRVVVVAYDDGIHPNPPSVVVDYEHFEGVDRIEGFEVSRTPEQFVQAFLDLAKDSSRPTSTPMREQVRWWLHFDDRTYAERLAEVVDRIAAPEDRPAAVAAR